MQGRALKAQLKKKRELDERAECTFRPQLNPNSDAIAAKQPERVSHNPDTIEGLTARLRQEQQDKAERLERARRQVEADKLKECTFQPQLASATPSTVEAKPLVVRGLGRYMELKQLAKRQAEAQKEREQKAFLIEPPARLQPYTVPEPFHLHDRPNDERAEKTRVEVEAARMAECTFAPKLKEPSVAALLKASTGRA